MKNTFKYLFLTLFLIASLISPAGAAWDKTKPAGNRALNQVDDDIRANNDTLEAALDQDHDFTTGSTQTGKHQQVTFKAVSALKPTVAAGEGALYTKTYNSKTELFYEDNNGSEFLVMVPVGTILPFMPGYFTNGSNAGYTYRLGSANTVAAINTLLNTYGWYVCDGSALNLATSPIFNGPSRYLPNLTDDRFLMGDTIAGTPGGSATHTHPIMPHVHWISHTHGTQSLTLTAAQSGLPEHTHYLRQNGGGGDIKASGYWTNPVEGLSQDGTLGVQGGAQNASQAHNHGDTGYSSIAYSGASSLENTGSTNHLPTYLSCLYIMRVH